jgi:superfamily II DNA/RNA helicase
MKTFSEFPLSVRLQSNLKRHGFTQPTPIQSSTIEPALLGRDLVATAPTGTGKTLAFVLPILHALESDARSRAMPRVPVSRPSY